jgi:hypothetical protein
MDDRALADDLHATSESLVADAKQVEEIEAQKEHLAPDDPQVRLLSIRSEKIVRRMAAKGALETELAKQATRRK